MITNIEVGVVLVSEVKYRFCIFFDFYLLFLFLLEYTDCGDAYQACDRSRFYQLFISLQLLICVCVCGICISWCRNGNDSDQAHSSAINNRSIIEQLRTPNRSNFVSIHSVARSSLNMQNSNLRRSMETQLPVDNNCRVERVSTTSSLPPAYNIVMRENSVTISEEYLSMLPPSYNDFMRKINETDA